MDKQLVYERVVEAQRLIMAEGIGKNKRNSGGGNFLYRGIDDVYQALSPVLVKCGLNIRPLTIVKEDDSVSGKMRLVRIKITYRIQCAEDGSYFDMESLGEGSDVSDKAAGKAMSYAFKNAIFQLLCIPVVGIDDPDATTVEPPTTFVDQSIIQRARAACMDGTEAYKKFFVSLPNDKRKQLQDAGLHAEFKKVAEDADNAQ